MIKPTLVEAAMRQSIDAACHHAIARFKEELGEHAALAHEVAFAAACSAMEGFQAWANSELRLIQIEHERLFDLRSRKMLHGLEQIAGEKE